MSLCVCARVRCARAFDRYSLFILMTAEEANGNSVPISSAGSGIRLGGLISAE